MIADLYDFDKTVFMGESGTEFYLFCLKRHPSLLKHLPRQIRGAFRYAVNRERYKNEIKNDFYCFLRSIDAQKEAELFWEKNADRMCEWFKPKEHDVATVICSASPAFQIKPICEKLGVTLVIGTDSDEKTGRLNDVNCKGEYKLDYIKKYAPDFTFRDVYTDNIVSDAPILSLATRNKFKVTNGKITKTQ